MGREARARQATAGQIKAAGAYFMLDVEKLTRDEHLMVGEINAVERWAKAFEEMRLQTSNIAERQFLSEIVRCLRNDAEEMGVELARHCQESGMGKIVQASPTTETEQ